MAEGSPTAALPARSGVVAIADPADERVSDYVGLNDPELRRRRERSEGSEGGFFIAEGALVIRQLLTSSYRVRSLLLTPTRFAALEPALAGLEAPVYVAPPEVLNTVSGFHLHRGALASADRPARPDVLELAAATDLVVVTENVNDHENLGSLFRNAAAFGAGAVLLDPTTADPLYRRSIRVSMGHVLRVPFTVVPAWPAALWDLQGLGFEVVALTPTTGAEDLRSVRPGGRRAVLVGAEGPGLSTAALGAADRRVRIPLAAGVDSLNVATALAVALHHLARPG